MQGIATLPYQVTEEPNYPAGGIDTIKHAADMMADFGRHGDTYIVHAAEGETVVPVEVIEANPRMKRMIHQQMEEMGLDPQRYIVGTEYNSINPVTGRPEFFLKKLGRSIKKGIKKVGKIAKKLAPIVLPIAAPFMFPLMPVAFSAGIGSLVGGMASGMKFKDALKSAAITAATAGTTQALRGKGFFGGMQGDARGIRDIGGALKSMTDPSTYSSPYLPSLTPAPPATPTPTPTSAPTNVQMSGGTAGENTYGLAGQGNVQTNVETAQLIPEERSFYEKYISPDRYETDLVTEGQYKGVPQYEAEAIKRTDATAKALASSGQPMTPEAYQAAYKSNLDAARPGALVRQAPRAAVIGTGILAADKLAGLNLVIPTPEEEEAAQGALGPTAEELLAQDPALYGFDYDRFIGRNPFYTMRAQEGGEIVGPGTGTSDSIPALLSDGEFVVTAKAVRNAGGGDRRAGAQRMYDMMKRLEQGGTA